MAEEGIRPGPWYVPGKWHVSPYCYEDEIRANYDLPDRIYGRDITLAEGSHAMGVHYTLDGAVEVAQAVTEVGLVTIKVPSHFGVEYTKRCTEEVPEAKNCMMTGVRSWSPAVQKLIDDYIDAGVYEFELLNLNINDAKCMDLIPYIKSRGVKVGAGLTNCLRRPWEEVWGYFSTTLAEGVTKIDVYDTYNVGTPDAVRFFIKKLKKATGGRVDICWQSHNDFGIGTACSVAAIEGGANWLDLSVCGMGDRSGNGSLEEVTLILESMYGVKTGIKKEKLWDLARLAEKLSGFKRDTMKAVVGEAEYFHESTSHAWGILKFAPMNPDVGPDARFIARNEPYSPFVFGAKRNVRIGGTSLQLIPDRLKQLGLKYTDEQASKIKDSVWDIWQNEHRDLSIEQFDDLAKKIIGGN